MYSSVIILLAFILRTIIFQSESYTFRCPSPAEWNLKANITCRKSNQYYCLLCPTTDLYECLRNPGGGYVEGCGGPVQERKGHKKIIAGSFTREDCTENRYQPVIFNTNETSDCIYKKYDCIEEGQVISNNGSLRTDRLCSCNYQTGYAYVETLQTQFCYPSGYEDCSCYVKSCDKFQSLSADYRCHFKPSTGVTGKDDNNRTSEILHHADLKFISDDSKLIADKLGIRHQSKTEITWLICSSIAICVILVICMMSGKLDHVFCTDISLLETVSDQTKLMNTAEMNTEDVESGDYAKLFIKDWREENKKFVITHASKHVLECIKNNSCVTVTGSSGVGKSATIRHVALQMEEEGYEIVNIKYPWDLGKQLNKMRNTLCVIDDCCGRYNISQIDLESWKKEMDDIKRLLKNSSTKIIIGCRLQVYNDKKFEALSVFKSSECNLQSDSFRLTETERQTIAELYLKGNATEIPKDNKWEFFPLLCRLSEGKSASDIRKLFVEPFTVYETELDKMNLEGAYLKRCVLALVVMFNNQLQENWFTKDTDDKTRSIIQNTCESCNLNIWTSRLELRDELESLTNTYLKKCDTVYSTIHDKLFDFFAYYFGKHITPYLIKNADSYFISERFAYIQTEDSDNFTIVIPEQYLQIYIDRLLKDWADGEVVNVLSNINMKKVDFRKSFSSHISNLDLTFQKDLVNRIDTITKTPVLVCNCYFGYEDFVHWCLSLHVDVNITGPDGVSPLNIACFEGYTGIVEMLLKNGADINKGFMNAFPLYIACENGYREIVCMLLNCHAHIINCNYSSASPLYIACQNGHTELVQILLKNNADINKGNNDVASPLYIACQNGHAEVVYMLLTNNVEINNCYKNGPTPLYSACQNGHTAIVSMLLDKQADINKCPDNGSWSLLINLLISHSETVNILSYDCADINKRTLNMNYEYNCFEIRVGGLINTHVDDMGMDYGFSPLFIACQNGHTEIVRKLLNKHANINWCQKDGVSSLFIACQMGQIEIVNMLLNHKAAIDKCNSDGESPLYIACQNGHDKVVDTLVNHNAEVDKCRHDGISPMYIACQCAYTEIVHILLNHNACVNKCRNNDVSPLHVACLMGYPEIVNLLLNQNADINAFTKKGESTLYIASHNGHTEILKMLLNHNADINICTHEGVSPLLIACQMGNSEIVNILLNHNANVDACKQDGVSPLRMACNKGYSEIVNMLLSNGADVNKCDKHDVSPLSTTCQNGNAEIFLMLLNHNADINKCTEDGVSCLFMACSFGYTEIVNILLNHNADITKCTNNGASPLYIACQNGHFKIVCKLVNTDTTDINKCVDIGESPLFVACQLGHSEIVNTLLKSNADIERCMKNGASPLYIACQNGHKKIVRMLLNQNADINKCRNDGASPVYVACKKGDKEIVSMLIETNADIDSCEKNKQSPLFIACENGHTEIVSMLLNKNADVNKCNKDGVSPLDEAFLSDYTEIVNMLQTNNSIINDSIISGRTSLFIACQRGRISSVSKLLCENVDINICIDNGASPLFIACQKGHPQIVDMLLNNNADINKCRNDGTSPLYIACDKGNTEIVSKLIDKNADIDRSENDNQSPLFIACQNGHKEIVSMLLLKNADVKKCNSDGLSPGNVAYSTDILKMLSRTHSDINT